MARWMGRRENAEAEPSALDCRRQAAREQAKSGVGYERRDRGLAALMTERGAGRRDFSCFLRNKAQEAASIYRNVGHRAWNLTSTTSAFQAWSFIEGNMHRFEMEPNSGTGNVDIDSQLETLFDMANRILFRDDPEPNLAEVRREIARLVSYLEFHFASEELAMVEHGYGSRRFHAAFHDHVLREARAIAARLGRTTSVEETKSAIFFLLEDWRVYHVAAADRQLASYLREQAPAGVTPHLPGVRPLKATGALAPDFDERILAAH
jgi:hemerythrin-like metal-binding protein